MSRLIAYIEADVEDACREHGKRGHLEHSVIQQTVAMYTEEEKQARIHGKFQHLIGLRFKRFARNIHVIKPFPIDPRNFTVYEALDPHPRTNDAVNWLAVDRKGNKYICDELWLKCQNGTEELASRVKLKAADYRIERRIIDPSALIQDQHTQQSLQGNLAKHGLSYIAASKARTAADTRIEDALAYSYVGNSQEFLKAPELFIFETCVRTIYEFEHYRWAEWKGKAVDEHDKKQTTVDKDDHMIENVGRLLFQEPQFTEMPYHGGGSTQEETNLDPYS